MTSTTRTPGAILAEARRVAAHIMREPGTRIKGAAASAILDRMESLHASLSRPTRKP